MSNFHIKLDNYPDPLSFHKIQFKREEKFLHMLIYAILQEEINQLVVQVLNLHIYGF